MKKKEFLVLGLGQFGRSLVRTLYNSDVDVMVIDRDESALEGLEEMATQAVCADASRPEVLGQFDLAEFDGAVVTFGHDLEASVKIIMCLSEAGVPFIMAKATSEFEGRIYRKVGAHKVIFPDREVGIRLGKEIALGNYYDALELSSTYSITDLVVPKSWEGKSIRELDLRKSHGINVIGIRTAAGLTVNPDPDGALGADAVLIVLGSNKDIMKMRSDIELMIQQELPEEVEEALKKAPEDMTV